MKFLPIFLLFTAAVFADSFTLDNNTSYKNIAIQWASSARQAQEINESLMQGDPLSNLYYPRKTKAAIPIPQNAMYFRVLVWQAKDAEPDLLTNWVELVPGKVYHLNEEHLTPLLLMNGMGC